MDLRKKKTLKAIREAFLELLRQKPVENITIKELAQKAEIGKATFYLHYHDVYDLLGQLQQEVVRQVLADAGDPALVFTDRQTFTRRLFNAFVVHQDQVETLFDLERTTILLPLRIEQELKQSLFRLRPEVEQDAAFNIQLTYQVMGGYYAYHENARRFGAAPTVDTIVEYAARTGAALGIET